MGLFDYFSAGDETKLFNQGFNDQKRYTKKGDRILTSGLNTQRSDLTQGKTEGLGYLQSGTDKGAGYVQQGLEPWQQLSSLGQQGIQDHYSLLSNPDSVFDSALYKAREEDTLNGLNRLANSRGMLASGNNTIDIINQMRTGGLDYFNTLLGGYQPYFGLGTQAAQGQADIYNRLGGMYDQLGANQSNVATGTASGLANAQGRTDALRAQAFQNLGNASADRYTNIANAQSQAQAAPWDLMLGLASAGASAYGAR